MRDRQEPCRVCGKPFIPCGKTSAEIGSFNYREVSCSVECGQEYLKRVLEGRKKIKHNSNKKNIVEITDMHD